MKKYKILWVIIKYCLFLFSLYTLVNIFTGEIEFSEIPSYILRLIIRLFVCIAIAVINRIETYYGERRLYLKRLSDQKIYRFCEQ